MTDTTPEMTEHIYTVTVTAATQADADLVMGERIAYDEILGVDYTMTWSTPALPATWPTTDEERAAFLDWQYEVSEAATTLGFRDWLAQAPDVDGMDEDDFDEDEDDLDEDDLDEDDQDD